MNLDVSFYINDELYVPPKRRSAHRRTVKSENEIVEIIEKLFYGVEQSKSYKWLNTALHLDERKGISSKLASVIVKFLASQINLDLGREYYRRRKSLMYWLDIHTEEVNKFLTENTIHVVFAGNKYLLYPPLGQNPLSTTIPFDECEYQNLFDLEDPNFSFDI